MSSSKRKTRGRSKSTVRSPRKSPAKQEVRSPRKSPAKQVVRSPRKSPAKQVVRSPIPIEPVKSPRKSTVKAFKIDSKPEQLFEADLIELVKQKAILYNVSGGDYKNRTAKRNAWQEISEELGKPVTDLKKKWQTLRNGYTGAKKRASGSAGGRPWHHLDRMNFLDGFKTLCEKPKTVPVLNLDGDSADNENHTDEEEGYDLNDETISKFAKILESRVDLNDDKVVTDRQCESSPIRRLGKKSFEEFAAASPSSSFSEQKSRAKKAKSSENASLISSIAAVMASGDEQQSTRLKFLNSLEDDVAGFSDLEFRKFRRKVVDAIDSIIQDRDTD